jgi:hypothetical protein
MEATQTRDERASSIGRLGALTRWGPTRRINLRDLDPAGRRIVLASIAAVRAEQAANAAEASRASGDPASR